VDALGRELYTGHVPETLSHFIITLACDDQPGIVHAVSGALVQAHGNITESQQFSSDDTGRFFMRLQVETASSFEDVSQALAPVTQKYAMSAEINTVGRPLRTLVLSSKAGHTLTDLLVRQRDGHLSITIPLVMSNHDVLQPLASFYDVPFGRSRCPRRKKRRPLRIISSTWSKRWTSNSLCWPATCRC